MYIIIPILIFDKIICSIILIRILDQITNSIEIRFLFKLVIVYIVYKVYKVTVFIFFDKLRLNLKNEWINYLTSTGRKIEYYEKLLPYINIFNSYNAFYFKYMNYFGELCKFIQKFSMFLTVFIFYFFSCAIICAHYQKSILGFNVWESELLLNYLKSFNFELANLIAFLVYSLMLTSFVLFVLGYFFALISIRLLQCIFPMTNRIADASDVPISFIRKAIEELESFNFSDNFEQKQDKKNQITQFISYALEFIKVDNGTKDPDYTNFCYILHAGHLSKAVQNDVLFRTNGLYKKIDELCIKINNMNCSEDKIVILQDLKMYLKVIEDRDLGKIEGIPYTIKESNIPTILIKCISIFQKIA